VPDAETLKALTVSSVLLVLIVLMGAAWIRDRNARVRDLKEQVERERQEKFEWREAHRLSEQARETQTEITRGHMDQARTSEAIIAGLRQALAQYRGSDDG